ncbi:uncharacterized protein CBL_13195 [Carabus blaptoides fortunei]
MLCNEIRTITHCRISKYTEFEKQIPFIVDPCNQYLTELYRSDSPEHLFGRKGRNMSLRCITRTALLLDTYNNNYISGIYQTAQLFCTYKSGRINNDVDDDERKYQNLAKQCFLSKEQTCFVIHPYIKWGWKKEKDVTAQSQMEEAVALINTLPGWKVCKEVIVPLESFDKKTLFGKGTTMKLKEQTRHHSDSTAIFLNMSKLRTAQIIELENIFQLLILDRYKVIMHILRAHATSTHAKLQVSLAEIPYLRSRLKYLDIGTSQNWETKGKMLEEREQKIKNAIKKLRSQRILLRNKRKDLNYPIVAIIGYTNAGKTSLVKSLTGSQSLKPENQLFATLDITMHAGLLPSKLKVLYVDTVGFISNIPTDLIECFIATFEDALLADVIIHVQDISHENVLYQRKHVNIILNQLAQQVGDSNWSKRVITVGNKWDIAASVADPEKDMILVSAKTQQGIDVLRQKIENKVLEVTDRNIITIRVPSGGQEMRWLYKEATVVKQMKDNTNNEFQFVEIIITNEKVKQFYKHFIGNN